MAQTCSSAGCKKEQMNQHQKQQKDQIHTDPQPEHLAYDADEEQTVEEKDEGWHTGISSTLWCKVADEWHVVARNSSQQTNLNLLVGTQLLSKSPPRRSLPWWTCTMQRAKLLRTRNFFSPNADQQ